MGPNSVTGVAEKCSICSARGNQPEVNTAENQLQPPLTSGEFFLIRLVLPHVITRSEINLNATPPRLRSELEISLLYT